MLKIDRNSQSLSLLDAPKLADVSITERNDLQEFIFNSPDAFFQELGLQLFLVGKEIEPSKSVQDRIDLLAIDKAGRAVIIELKRGNHKLHMLQAISYAGMISQWSAEEFMALLDADQQEMLADFLEVDVDEVNRIQRIVLIAEAFDYALLISAEWLSDNYSVDVMCCRISIAKDAGSGSEYLVCSNVYPAPELTKEAIPRGRRAAAVTRGTDWPDWDTALANIDNAAVAEYFRDQLAANREAYLRKRILHYRIQGKRRWFITARQSRAYVWQRGRFDDDIAFWQRGLSEGANVKPVKAGSCLRFFLKTKDDVDFFHTAATQQLQNVEWLASSADEELEE